MASSATDICNLALGQIGHTAFIQNIETEDSDEADICNQYYEQDRDEVLSLAHWRCAGGRWLPAALDPTTLENGRVPTGWCYAFPYPPDGIKMREIWSGRHLAPTEWQEPFDEEHDGRLQTKILLANKQTPEFLYTRRIEQVTLYSPALVRLIAERLVVDLALAIKKDPALAKDLMSAFLVSIESAAQGELGSVNPGLPPEAHHLAVR